MEKTVSKARQRLECGDLSPLSLTNGSHGIVDLPFARVESASKLAYVYSAVVGTARCAARCAVRAPFEGRNVYVTGTCRAIGSARSDAGEDIAARCPYR